MGIEPVDDPQVVAFRKLHPTLRIGARMVKDDADFLTGLDLHPHVFTQMMQGNLVIIALEPPPDNFGLVKIPDSAYKEPGGAGWIVAVGPFAGDPMYAQMGGVAAIGPICDEPWELLGLHVTFSAHSGVPLRLTMLEKRFCGEVLSMSCRDCQTIDLNPVSLVTRAQDKIKADSAQMLEDDDA